MIATEELLEPVIAQKRSKCGNPKPPKQKRRFQSNTRPNKAQKKIIRKKRRR